jgi:hypothetical protein
VKTYTLSLGDFIQGRGIIEPKITIHTYRATLVPSHQAIRVTDESGSLIAVHYSATGDRRTMMAYVEDVGYIGGWQYPHRAMPFHYLIVSINRGVLYSHSHLLPRRLTNRQVICPRCQYSFWMEGRGEESTSHPVVAEEGREAP